MVFLHFPSAYTDEELMLKAKYAKLRKKKAALHAYLNPKSEPEKVNSLKRPLEPKEAKEYAKKLVLSGKITVPNKGSGSKAVFKKPQGLLRRLTETRASAIVAPTLNPDPLFQSSSGVTGVSSGVQYKPFTPSQSSSNSESSNSSPYASPYQDRKFSIGKKRFHHNFTSNNNNFSTDGQTPLSAEFGSETAGGSGMNSFRRPVGYASMSSDYKPKQGKTIHVRGFGILTEEICREAFNNIGSIITVVIESDRNCGFVTFENVESAEKAIQEVNETFVRGTKLQVSYARRQLPVSELIGEGSPVGLAWATIAANPSQKATFKDKREAVVYDDFD